VGGGPGKRIVVWRHGRTASNFAGRFQGQQDVPLDEVGVGQAAAAARVLAALEPAAIVSSDLCRASATAAALAALTGLEVAEDRGLRETDLGSWSGLTRAEVEERFPGEAEAWLRGAVERRGGGENMAEVAARCVAATEAALDKLAHGATLVVVTHGGSGRVLIASLVGLPPEHWRALGGLSNCCWSVVTEGRGGWVLQEHNAGSLPQPVEPDPQSPQVVGDDAALAP
jgi:broad specificity phosphatase PhoE